MLIERALRACSAAIFTPAATGIHSTLSLLDRDCPEVRDLVAAADLVAGREEEGRPCRAARKAVTREPPRGVADHRPHLAVHARRLRVSV